MHEFSMHDRHWCRPKDESFSKFSDIWSIDKTHNEFLAHELIMRFKLLKFARKLFLMLIKKTPPPPLRINLCLFYIISTQTIYIYKKIHKMNGFVKLRAVSKLSFLY
jgi:hypothetical protein